jgi:acyl-coenzyme A thioesterase PaaI-like protein
VRSNQGIAPRHSQKSLEIMGWTSYVYTQKMAVTSELNIKFLQPTYICGKQINVTCHVTSHKSSKINMQAKILNVEGVVCTIATGTYHILPQDKYKTLIKGKE